MSSSIKALINLIEDWNDVKLALLVAHLGTLSAAAEALNIHHSTVLRRIEHLEKQLGTRLFIRHSRGYQATDAGQKLAQTAHQTMEDFARLTGELKGSEQDLTGELVITTVGSFSSALMPWIREFCQLYPGLQVHLVAERRLLKLELGEAHISLRPGEQPREPDYIAQKLFGIRNSLYAHRDYLQRHGTMANLQDYQGQQFVGLLNLLLRVPMFKWLDQVPNNRVVFKANDSLQYQEALRNGLGIGLMDCWNAEMFPELQEAIDTPPNWQTQLWLLTHKDQHRSAKVQAFNHFIKEKATMLVQRTTETGFRH